MIKVCHLVDNLNVGGLENIVKEIVLHLKGYEHKVLCLKKKGFMSDEIERGGIKIKEFDFEGKFIFGCISKLVKELKKEKFDIIHCYDVFPSIWGRTAAIFAGVPVKIVHCGNLSLDVHFKERIKLKALSFFTDKIIAVANAVKKSLIEVLRVDPDKIEIVYSSAREFKAPSVEEKNVIMNKLGIKKEDFIIGSIGRLIEIKGHRYLLDAAADLKTEMPNIKCLIVGYGPEMDVLRKRIEELDLEHNVILAGLRTDIDSMLSLMNIFVYPSILKEGLPLSLAAAASAGLPLIATPIGGNSEIVIDARNGFIVNAKDAAMLANKIGYLVNNPLERKRMGEESRKIWNNNFTSEEMLKKIDNIYQGSLQKRWKSRNIQK